MEGRRGLGAATTAPSLVFVLCRALRDYSLPYKRRDRVAWALLQEASVEATEPRCYPEHDPDYYVLFFKDRDGVRLEVTNFRE
jgi:hypothetical protein